MKKIFLYLIISLMVLLPVITLATSGLGDAKTKLGQVTKGSGLESGDLSTLEGAAGLVIKGALSLVGTVFLILTVYAGILWMTASGKEEQVEKASKIIKASVIGLFIVMSSYAITYFITTSFGAGSGSSSTGTAGTEAACHQLGGLCVNNSDGKISDSLGNSLGIQIKPDPSQPCDPNGTGSADPFTGTSLGVCGTGIVCCELSESTGTGADKGKFKCINVMKGTCVDVSVGGSCPAGTTQKGECDTSAWDPYCCVSNVSKSGS